MRSDESGALYETIGGMDACRALAAAFYAGVEHDPVLRPLYPPSLHCAVDSLGLFIGQFFGGPRHYSRQRPWLSLREAHARFGIGPAERDAWLVQMDRALDAINCPEPARSGARAFFEQAADWLVNHPAGADPTDGRLPAPLDVDAGITHLWPVQRMLDEIVAASRRGDAERAISLAEGMLMRSYFDRDRVALVGLLAVFGTSGNSPLLEYARGRLVADRTLVLLPHSRGRTLLHDAADQGNTAFAKVLLELGADSNATDAFGHAPLYLAGNGAGNAAVVRALIDAGADPNAAGGLKGCTALHMAARRGNLGVAEALLDRGANLEARDSQGETPLRRAVNCGKTEMVAFLLARGANAQARGSRGLTPWQAARGAAMRHVLAPYARNC